MQQPPAARAWQRDGDFLLQGAVRMRQHAEPGPLQTSQSNASEGIGPDDRRALADGGRRYCQQARHLRELGGREGQRQLQRKRQRPAMFTA